MNMRSFLSVVLGSVSLSMLSLADVTVSFGGISAVNTTTNAPTQNVFASTENTSVNSGLAWRWDNGQTPSRRDISQSFYTGTISVVFDKITFKTAGANISAIFKDNADVTFTLQIYSVSTASAFPSDGTLVSSQQGNFAGFGADREVVSGNISGSLYNYVTFDFDNVTLNAESYYSVVLKFDEQGAGFNIAFGNNGNNTYYLGGTGAISEGETWSAASDYYFYAQAVPEPGVTAAILFGGALLLGLRSVRRKTTV